MQPALLVRLRPRGPWRFGAPGSAGERPDSHFRSDRLYSALTQAMDRLGFLSEWIDDTAKSQTPALCFSSLFPFQGDAHFVLPPANLWPPPAFLVTAPSPVFLNKVRWSAAQFVPVSLVEAMLLGQKILAEQWVADPDSGCLLRRDRPSTSPFRVVSRRTASVDRSSQVSHQASRLACVEFEPDSGMWAVLRFRDSETERTWRPRVEAAFRLLCDSGFGGRKRSGWGQAEFPDITSSAWPNILFPRLARSLNKIPQQTAEADGDAATSYWLLSLLVPGSADKIDWGSGSYALQMRGGHVDSPSGRPGTKKPLRMVVEGSVLQAKSEPVGQAPDVAPEGFEHPVYRSGIALSLALPVLDSDTEGESAIEAEAMIGAVEEPLLTPASEEPEELQDTSSADDAVASASTAEESVTPPETGEDGQQTGDEHLSHWSEPGSGEQTSDEIRSPDESPFIPSTSVPDADTNAETTSTDTDITEEGAGEPSASQEAEEKNSIVETQGESHDEAGEDEGTREL